MDPVLIDFAVAATVGGILVALGGLAGFRIGRAASDPGGIQARETVRELQGINRDNRRRMDAIRDRVSQLKLDPRTAPQDRMYLEDHVEPLLVDRRRVEERK